MQWNTVTSNPYFLPLTFPIFAALYHMSIVMAHSLYVHRYGAIHWSWRNLPVVTPSKENNHPYRVWAGLPLYQSCISNQRYCQFITKTAVPRLDYSISQDAVPPSSSYILTSFSSGLLNNHDSGNNIDILFRAEQSNQFGFSPLTACCPGQKVFCKPRLWG